MNRKIMLILLLGVLLISCDLISFGEKEVDEAQVEQIIAEYLATEQAEDADETSSIIAPGVDESNANMPEDNDTITISEPSNPSPPSNAIFTANQDMWCRAGPDTFYEEYWTIKAGERHKVLAKWHDSEWLLVEIDDVDTRTNCCWAGGNYDLNVDMGTLLEIDYFVDRESCNLNDPLSEPNPKRVEGPAMDEQTSNDTYPEIRNCATSRIFLNDTVEVSSGAGHVGVRSYPDTAPSDNVIERLPAGTRMQVVGGPICNYGWVLWKIRTNNGVMGWVPETDGGSFFLIPKD